jgi:nonsense-mediated mRNA decay protein 3
VGQTRDGLDMYRVSYLVRLPEFEVGDIVTFRKKYYMLKRVSSQGGRLVSMKDFRELPVKRQDMPEVKVFAKRSEAREAVVVSTSDKEIQVMDPSTYETIDLRIPMYSEVGETVPVISIEDVLYYVPPLK